MRISDWSSDVCSSDLPGGGFDVYWNRKPPGPGVIMEALLTSTAVVALAELGDKTQLLAILLAARFNRPMTIIFGILVATLAHHAPAALLGASAAACLDSPVFRYPRVRQSTPLHSSHACA